MIDERCQDCGNCCLETEMILSIEEIESILSYSQKTLKKDDFCFVNEMGLFQLKNINGRCVFFNPNSKLCNIYKVRPRGCKFYPLIYDPESKRCNFDKDCPRTDLFYQNKNEFNNVCKQIKNYLRNKLFLRI